MRTAEDVTYLEIICKNGKKGLPWQKIEEMLCGEERRVLMPIGITPPSESKIKRFVPDEYNIALFEEMLVQTLNKIKNKGKLYIALCTNEEQQAKRILERIINTANIKVISLFHEKLSDLQAEILENYGAAVPMVGSPGKDEHFNVIFAPEYLPPNIKTERNIVVFSKKANAEGIKIREITGNLPHELEEYYSNEYDKKEFAAAFYELGNSRLESLLSPVYAISLIKSYTPEELAAVIDKYINIPTAE
ncbi:MAG: hypothetical protein IJL87_06710 [Clostridia bacterium]|nr:hypothetical protein [Clostridia bacterium]